VTQTTIFDIEAEALNQNKHAPIVYEVRNKILQQPYKWRSPKDLALQFLGRNNPGDQTAIREIVRAITLDEEFQTIIISSKRGFKVAETEEEVEQYLDTMMDTAMAYLDRYWTTVRKKNKNQQAKLQIGPYDTTEFISIIKTESDRRKKARGGKTSEKV
jgi:hypothetical protein